MESQTQELKRLINRELDLYQERVNASYDRLIEEFRRKPKVRFWHRWWRPLWGAFLLGLAVSPAAAQDRAFAAGGATVSLSATTTTSRAQIQASAGVSPHVRLYNPGSVAVFVNCGDVTVVATLAAGMPIAPASVEVIACPQTHVAGITASGAVTLYATPGNGI